MKGFTLLELLIVIAILAALVALGLFMGIDAYRSYALRAERDTVVSLAQRARSRAVNNIRESNHGLSLQPATHVLFQGASYASRNPSYDEIVPASPGISATGTSEVVFSQLTGESSASGTITLSNDIRSYVISINSEGRIEW